MTADRPGSDRTARHQRSRRCSAPYETDAAVRLLVVVEGVGIELPSVVGVQAASLPRRPHRPAISPAPAVRALDRSAPRWAPFVSELPKGRRYGDRT